MKYKTRSLKERLAICQMIENGMPAQTIRELTGVSFSLQQLWHLNYEIFGKAGLKKRKYRVYSESEKMFLIHEYQKKDVPLLRFCVEHKVSQVQFRTWYKAYQAESHLPSSTLPLSHKPQKMVSKKINDRQLSKDELLEELAYLRAENALLKKVKALMDEREARELKTGHKPSNH